MSGADDAIEFDTSNLAKVIASLGDIFEDAEQTLHVAADMLVSEVHDRWQSAGDGTWAPLAPSTLAKRRGTVAQILIDTGRAFASVSANHTKDSAEASTDVGYMRFHCGDAPRTKLPKRDPFELSDEAHDRVTDFILEDLLKRWAASQGASDAGGS